MKKYTILIGLVGLLALSITRVSFISTATDKPLTVAEMREKYETNPSVYMMASARINELLAEHADWLKKYEKATSPTERSKISGKLESIRKELNKWIK